MKKYGILLFVFLMFGMQSFAKKLEGYYITGKKDTVKTTFDIPWIITGEPDFEKLQWEVEYFDGKGKKTILNPEWVSEYGFSFKDKSYRMLAKRNSLLLTGSKKNGTTILFLRVLVDGQAMQLCQFYVVSTAPGNSSSVYNSATVGSSTSNDKYIFIKKSDGKQFRPRISAFNKEVSVYLSDVPELTAKVESKELGIKDVELIAQEYNRIINSKTIPQMHILTDSSSVK